MSDVTQHPMWIKASELVLVYGLRLLSALAIFFIGKWLARLALRLCLSAHDGRLTFP